MERSSEPTPPQTAAAAAAAQEEADLPSQESSSSPSKMKELQEKLARLNSRYVVGSGVERSEVGKVGLAALQDIAARQEANLEDTTPTNDPAALPANKMSLGSLPSSPSRSIQAR